MYTRFTASQSVEIVVPEQPLPIQHYLRQPQRLVKALVDPSRIEQLDDELFRLKIRPLSFMTLSIQPTADLKVWAEPNGTLNLRSVACEILGLDYINQRFELNLQGHLSPYQRQDVTLLRGKADLEVKVELPFPLNMTPQPIVETTGNGLLKSVLMTIKQRLLHQLLTDYRSWVNDNQNQLSVNSYQLPVSEA
jgi:Protein of unknown function (DUF1997)